MADNTQPTPDTTQRPRPPGPEAARGEPNNNPPRQRWVIPRWVWLMLALALLLNWFLAPLLAAPEEIRVVPYSLFKAQARAGNVSEITT
ncbi:MAG: cell division protein FtsH, partial [Chloroflexota bacterium]|nr:cell division protein FtsH [Chloroflexota bacterium]